MDPVTSRVKFTEERIGGDAPTPWKVRIVGTPSPAGSFYGDARVVGGPSLCVLRGSGEFLELRRYPADPFGKEQHCNTYACIKF